MSAVWFLVGFGWGALLVAWSLPTLVKRTQKRENNEARHN